MMILKRRYKKRIAILLFGGLLIFLTATVSAGRAATVDQDLASLLDTLNPEDNVSIIVTLRDQVALKKYRGRNKKIRRSNLNRALRGKALSSQKALKNFFKQKKAKKVTSFWVFNGMAAKLKAKQIRELASQPGVERVQLDGVIYQPQASLASEDTAEWNLDAIGAPHLWDLGHTGNGIVVAGMDTGVDVNHPDLAPTYRGGENSWYDPHGEYATPYDHDGHGTQTMGIMVGGDAGGTAIGVAPGANWIAVKMFNDAGSASHSVIHQSFQWLLDPDGDPDTDDLPDIVNSSWGFSELVGECFTEFQQDIDALKAANIAVIFSAGNNGPDEYTSVSPANNSGTLAVGAVDDLNIITNKSSRGPSECDGSVYPKVVAPGAHIKTSDLTFGGVFPDSYVFASGTSYAAPHLAGSMALLMSAFPEATIGQLEQALESDALDLGVSGPDNVYGNGLIDLMETYSQLVASCTSPDSLVIEPRFSTLSSSDTDTVVFFDSSQSSCYATIHCVKESRLCHSTWDFGGAGQIAGGDGSHIIVYQYDAPGSYSPTLTLTESMSGTTTSETQTAIAEEVEIPMPAADFVSTINDEEVTLTATLPIDVTQLTVFWGDRTRTVVSSAPFQDPIIHPYTRTGTSYYIHVQIIDTGGNAFNYSFANDNDLTVTIP